jgi:hypothetical protein
MNELEATVRALRDAPYYNAGLGTSTIENEAADLLESQKKEIEGLKEKNAVLNEKQKYLELAFKNDGKCMLCEYRGTNCDCPPCCDCVAISVDFLPEPETKTIQEWAALDGIKVYDPDGFDRTDPLLMERKITKAEYDAGILRCTVLIRAD